MADYRVLVTGSRDWFILAPMLEVMLDLERLRVSDGRRIVLVHGGASGADSMAAGIAAEYGWGVETHRAEWGVYGAAAGPIRNGEMVSAGADECIAFLRHDRPNRGTLDCVRRARAAGIPVKEVWG